MLTRWILRTGYLDKLEKPERSKFFKDTIYRDGIVIATNYRAMFLLKFAKELNVVRLRPLKKNGSIGKQKLWIMPARAEAELTAIEKHRRETND